MRAMQITELSGPKEAMAEVELPDPTLEGGALMTPGEGVLIDVEAAGVSFPEVLQTRGEYQFKPELPFVPGSEVAGTVIEASSGFAPGDRVMGFCMLGGFAEKAVVPVHFTFPLSDELDFAQGASVILNYHTAWFALVTRGQLKEGETVLVQGAAGGVGTATIQVAKGMGARTIAVVSTEEKEKVAREAGADEVVRSDGEWKDAVIELGGADMVVDPVGGDRFTDSLRTLKRAGRLVVVGFTGGAIPEVKVNRLLLKNTSVVGAGWGEWALSNPAYVTEVGEEIGKLTDAGFVRPVVGARFPLADASAALELIDGRGATGKVVLETG